jgi:hypothetical protein
MQQQLNLQIQIICGMQPVSTNTLTMLTLAPKPRMSFTLPILEETPTTMQELKWFLMFIIQITM